MKKSLMLIDDNDIDLFINKRLAEISEFANNIDTYNTAMGAYEALARGNKIPDVIFLDINMPVMNGFGFLDKLGILPTETRKRLKVVVLSSSTLQDEVMNAFDTNSVDEFISKPLTMNHLRNLERKLFSPGTQAEVA